MNLFVRNHCMRNLSIEGKNIKELLLACTKDKIPIRGFSDVNGDDTTHFRVEVKLLRMSRTPLYLITLLFLAKTYSEIQNISAYFLSVLT